MKENNTDKKKNILDVAERLFAQNGYDSTSTREIADQAGVNVAMIAYYYGSKENLLKAVISRYGQEALALVRDQYDATLPPDERLRKLFATYMDYAFGHPDPIVIAHRELGIAMRPDLHESIAEIFNEIQEMIQSCINDGRQTGLFRDVDVPLFIFTIAGMYDHMVNQVHVMQNLKLDGSIYGLPETDQFAIREKIQNILWDITDSYLKKR